MSMSSAAAPAGVLDSAPGVSIAYHKTAGKSPGVVFLGGFMSDMTGAKALAVEAYCRARGHAIVRFDYRGHGQSSGQFVDGTISLWTNDALAVIDRLTEGPQILVGSSMGGWIALLASLARPTRVAGLTLIAPAPDFVDDLIWGQLSAEQKATIQRDGVLRVPSAYNDQGYAISMALIEDGRKQSILDRPIPFDGPVRILHGMQDADVPWQRSLTLADRLTARDVRTTFLKDGDHRLSRDQDLALLTATLGSLLGAVEQRL
jgi:pimeloyl-ACP methyl ester carboxylesterase